MLIFLRSFTHECLAFTETQSNECCHNRYHLVVEAVHPRRIQDRIPWVTFVLAAYRWVIIVKSTGVSIAEATVHSMYIGLANPARSHQSVMVYPMCSL